MPLFGQVVVGPPGAGKSTYCLGMGMFCKEIEREVALVNLDFANDGLPYVPAVDVRNFLTLQDAMEKYELGPNGGLVFCMEMLLENIDWLVAEIERVVQEAESSKRDLHYFVFDCPGQVELYSHHDVVQQILKHLQDKLDFRLCSVLLIDSFLCSQPATFISATLLVTSTMLRLELPHVNVLSKIDLLKNYGPLPFNLDFFTEMLNLSPLLRYIDGRVIPVEELEAKERAKAASGKDSDDENDTAVEPPGIVSGRSKLQEKFKALTAALCEVVDDYALVSFLPMNIEDAETVGRVLAAIDRANGYLHVRDYIPRSTSDKTSTARDVYHFAADQLESSVLMSLEIQEKYGSS